MARAQLSLVALAALAVIASCDETKPAATDSKVVVDTKVAVEGKVAVDSKGTVDTPTADLKGKLDLPANDQKLAGDKGKADAATSFPCGALLSCTIATQYCEKFTGGACGGPDPSDAGVCPPNCNLTSCGGGKQVCLCSTYACKALPSGCTSCSCVGAAASCSCSKFASGAINVVCTAP